MMAGLGEGLTRLFEVSVVCNSGPLASSEEPDRTVQERYNATQPNVKPIN